MTHRKHREGRMREDSVSPTVTGKRRQPWARQDPVWQGTSVPVWESMTQQGATAQ